MKKRKALFLALIGTFILCLLSTPQELLAKTSQNGKTKIKKEPSEAIKQIHGELNLKINQIKKKTDHPQHLKDAEKKIKVISSLIENVQPKIKPETADSREEIEITPNSRALIDKKRDLQAEIHTADFPLAKLKDELAKLIEKKEKLESEYFLAQIEISMLLETASGLSKPEIIIEGKVELRQPDDINIILSLGRSVPASAFCEVHLNNVFIRRERWKIDSKGKFKTKLISSDKVKPNRGMNDIMIVLNTTYQDDDITLKAPSFKENPLTIFSKSKIAARTLISTDFKLKEEEEKDKKGKSKKEEKKKKKETEKNIN